MSVAARERWNRWNERQARGAYVIPVELNDVLVGAMLDAGLISERDSRSRERLGAAVRNFLANALAAEHATGAQGEATATERPIPCSTD